MPPPLWTRPCISRHGINAHSSNAFGIPSPVDNNLIVLVCVDDLHVRRSHESVLNTG